MGSYLANLNTIIPHGTSYDQAEKDMLELSESRLYRNYRRRLKSRGGSRMVTAREHYTYWEDVNPVSADRFTTSNASIAYF